MSDNNTETETNAEGTAADTFHVFQNETWLELNPDTLQIGGRDEAILLMKDDNLVMLEPEQLSHMLRTGKGLQYEPIRTTKRHTRKKKKRRRVEVTPRVESLLEQLNSHMALMTKMLMSMPKWLKNTQTHLTQEKPSTRQSPSRTHVVVAADIHDKPNGHLKSSSRNRIEEKQITPDRTAQGKNKEFVVSPTSIQAISEFSQKHLDFINYKGRDRVSPDTFDKDDEYCRLLLHKFNPLVELTKSAYIDKLVKRAMRPKETIAQKLPLTRFAATLGLVGVEKKKFMSEILERRRKQRTYMKNYQESGSSEEEYLTDSSGVSEVKEPEFQRETRLNKRKKDTLKVAAKRFKALEESLSQSIVISSSEDSDDDTFQATNKKRNAQIAKKTKSRVARKKYTSEDESDANHRIISELKSKNEVKFKSGRTADAKKSDSTSKKSPNSSLNNSLRRRDLEKVVEDDEETETATAKENSEPAYSSYVKKRVYTMVEDHIILSHILKNDNSTLVKGNVMWKNFARTFRDMAKHTRTWQSLKNRYLKYILPNIKLYGLSPDKERHLRATAYIGEIQKTRRGKENSIFKVQPVMSASNVLRQKESMQKLLHHSQKADPVASTSKTLVKSSSSLRTSKRFSPASSTPKQSPKKLDPTYSELTRRFHMKAKVRLGSRSSNDGSESGSGKEFQKSGSRRLYNLRE